jgi:transcriptional regulator with XRE-family HTH domain
VSSRKTFGATLFALRSKAGLTLERFAFLVGAPTSKSTVLRWENGVERNGKRLRVHPHAAKVPAIASALGCSDDEEQALYTVYAFEAGILPTAGLARSSCARLVRRAFEARARQPKRRGPVRS